MTTAKAIATLIVETGVTFSSFPDPLIGALRAGMVSVLKELPERYRERIEDEIKRLEEMKEVTL